MKDVAELLKACAALLWPLLTFAALIVFRGELRGLLARLRRGKVLGQEIELEALMRKDERALPSAALSLNFDDVLNSAEFRAKLRHIVHDAPASDDQVVIGKLIDVVKDSAEESIKRSFVTIDTTPLLGYRGQVFEEPYLGEKKFQFLLDRIWSLMYPHVRPFAYPEGWVLRDRTSGQALLANVNRRDASGKMLADPTLKELGIAPGTELEVVPGPHPKLAFVRSGSLL
jgi:hypothetical protein